MVPRASTVPRARRVRLVRLVEQVRPVTQVRLARQAHPQASGLIAHEENHPHREEQRRPLLVPQAQQTGEQVQVGADTTETTIVEANPDGTVKKIYRKVDVANHANEIAADVR